MRVDGVGLLRQDHLPVRRRRLRGIDADDAAVRRVVVGEDQQLAADALEHVVGVVADRRNQRRELRARLRQVLHEDGVALLAGAAIGDVEHREALVLGRAQRVEALRVLLVAEHQLVGRLRRADAVVVDHVVLVDRGQLLALRRRRIAAVVEAVAAPRDARDLDPLDLVVEQLARRQVEHAVLLPVRAAARHAVGQRACRPSTRA